MLNLLRTEFSKLFKRKEFNIVLTAEIVLIAVFFISTSATFYKSYTSELPSAYQLWIGYENTNFNFIKYLYYLFFLTLPASIAFADTFLEDKKGHVLNFIITRCNKSLYILSKGIVVFFSGFIVIFLPLLIHQLLCIAALPLYTASEVIVGNPTYDRYYLTKLYFQGLHAVNPYLHNLLYIFLDGLFGGTIAVFAYSLSFLKNVNRYIVMIFPTVLFFTENFLFALLGMANYSLSYYLYATTGIKGLDYKVFTYSLAALLIVSLLIIILSSNMEKDEI